MIEELKEVLPEKIPSNTYGFHNYYGVRLPILRNIAKKIIKEKRYDFFNEKHYSFEELTIHAYAIGYLKEDINTCLKYLLNSTAKFVINSAVNLTCSIIFSLLET